MNTLIIMSKDLFNNASTNNHTKSRKDYFQKQNGTTSYPLKSTKLKTPNLPPPPSNSILRKSTK
jgi:hypothetical protein